MHTEIAILDKPTMKWTWKVEVENKLLWLGRRKYYLADHPDWKVSSPLLFSLQSVCFPLCLSCQMAAVKWGGTLVLVAR